MFLLRLVTTALCAACVVLLVTLPSARMATPPPSPVHIEPGPCLGPPRTQPLTVIDVAAGVTPSQLGELLHLRSDERITAVNDRPLTCGVETAEQIAERAPRAGGYIDLTVTSEMAERRILVLMH
jgi:hypothetical protein